ncbi:MAG: polyisoprenoid-binding protein [Alphaproteobacteria bacterium]|nr:polyisoprenoid-binding protein [Alphaproteobacteria bacterium]
MRNWISASALMVVLAAPAAAQDVPAGAYKLDKHHASLTFTVNHLGFSNYTAQFTSFDVALELDPKNPAAAKLTATIDPKSLDLPAPPEGFKDELLGPNWLDAAKYPEMTFTSTKVEVTGEKTATVTGDFTLHGVTKPVTLEVTFNGGYPGMPEMDPQARVGFSAKGVLKRSEFGVAYGVPAPGTTMGVSDEVQIAIEAELNGPPLGK